MCFLGVYNIHHSAYLVAELCNIYKTSLSYFIFLFNQYGTTSAFSGTIGNFTLYYYIIIFFETEEAKREFEAWKIEQEKKPAEKMKNEAMPK